MSNSPLSPSPAGFPPATFTPCPTPPSSVFSRLTQPKTVAKHPASLSSEPSPGDESATDMYSGATPKRCRLEQSVIPKAKIKAIRELSVGFVFDSDVPFTIFEHSFLRKIFIRFDSDLVVQMAWSGSCITGEVHQLLEAKRDTIKAELRNALTAVHISFDLWTSPNRFAIMAVFAHFIDQLGHQQSRLLALRRQSGAHSGENPAGSLVDIVHEWEIEGRKLDPSMRPVDIKACRMRCYVHTLNLVARAFLFGKDADSFELESDINSMRGLIEQDLDHWRTKGPIGKLHNIVKFMRSSPQRSEQFKRIAREQDYEGYRLCEESTAELHGRARAKTGTSLAKSTRILRPVYLQMMRTQGWGKGDSHGRLWEVLVGMEYLLEHFEDWKVFYSEVMVEIIGETNLDDLEPIGTSLADPGESNGRPSRVRRLRARFDENEVYEPPQRIQLPSALPADHWGYIRASINNGWKMLSKYYDELEESPLFAAAIILHPRFGISWLEATWVSEEQLTWVRDAKVEVKDNFTPPMTMDQEDDRYTQWMNSKTKKALSTSGSVGELERYLRLEPQDTQDAIQWKRDRGASFPSLSSFALDVFAIPAMASDCDRQFSLGKLTLTSRRLSMGADTLERVPCLKNWARHGGVKLGSWVGN
ncbi:hypothetical protein FANTH_14191 [Fusarium anthophilum]|uniref:HAT C-terminal dimerisation domain-containing protein n=1 Tax=Fusarium anthophilum TaxID=48485 RepID=A0A8H4YKC1_9HYPO|nr:hypothetical protein FANTH_14191 [Fusarium anthophilum]